MNNRPKASKGLLGIARVNFSSLTVQRLYTNNSASLKTITQNLSQLGNNKQMSNTRSQPKTSQKSSSTQEGKPATSKQSLGEWERPLGGASHTPRVSVPAIPWEFWASIDPDKNTKPREEE